MCFRIILALLRIRQTSFQLLFYINGLNNTDVKNIDQQYGGKNRKELIIERLVDFNKVTIELIDPNKLLNPTMCKEKNIRSIEE